MVFKGLLPTSRIFRMVSSFEMAGTYCIYFFLVYAVFIWYRSRCFWFVFLFSIAMLLNQGLIIVNLGTLYRVRFFYITLLNVLGMCGLAHLILNKRNIRSNITE